MKRHIKLILLTLCLVCMFGTTANAATNKKLKAPAITLSNVAASGKIKISWKPITGATSYQVYRSTNGTKWSKLITTKKTSITNTSVVAGKSYYYKVRAIAPKSVYNSNFSNAKSRTCDLPRPSVTLTNNTSTGKIKISWKPVNGAVAYRVYRSTNNKTWTSLIKTSKTSVTNNSATAGTKYYYKVRAIAKNTAANSADSSVKYKTCKLARPSITLSTVELTGKTKISWKKIDRATSYLVYCSTNKKDWTCLKTTKELSFTYNQGKSGTKYYYKVKAKSSNSAANSEFSSIKSLICQEPSSKTETRYVARPTIAIYTEPTSNSDYIVIPYMTKVGFGAPVTFSSTGSWHRLSYNNQIYYIWMEPDTDKLTDTKSSFTYDSNTQYQREVLDLGVDIALNWDTFYTHDQSNGIMNPDGSYGFDCSGFVSYVLNTVMQKRIPTYRLTANVTKLAELTDIYNAGFNGAFYKQTISMENIQPGDVLYFSLESKNDHCAIYLGNNEFVHSTNSVNGVVIAPLYGKYVNKMSGIYRYIPTTITPANQNVEMAVSCNLYGTFGKEDKIDSLKQGELVTILFTGNSNPSYNQAYIKTSDGTKGFVYTKNFR